MSRPAKAVINLDAIRHNYCLARSLAPKGQAVAIVKADAYGHGAVEVAHCLESEAPAFGVACIEEALILRQAGIRKPILLLEGFFTEDELPLISQHNFWTAVHDSSQIQQIARAKLSKPIQVWLKVDSGMHRLGFAPMEVADAYRQLTALPQVTKVICMSHFARADETNEITTQQQLNCFNRAVAALGSEVSLANSAATLIQPSTRGDWLRPGIMLYGADPLDQSNPTSQLIRPAMTLSSRVIAVRELPAGEAVGYGATWRGSAPTRVGTVAIGYADGYPRHAPSGTPLLVDGKPSQLIGRVSMDMLTVDLTHCPEAGIGSEVELWGEQISANEIAALSQTISYTLFTGLNQRVPRVYKQLEQARLTG